MIKISKEQKEWLRGLIKDFSNKEIRNKMIDFHNDIVSVITLYFDTQTNLIDCWYNYDDWHEKMDGNPYGELRGHIVFQMDETDYDNIDDKTINDIVDNFEVIIEANLNDTISEVIYCE